MEGDHSAGLHFDGDLGTIKKPKRFRSESKWELLKTSTALCFFSELNFNINCNDRANLKNNIFKGYFGLTFVQTKRF